MGIANPIAIHASEISHQAARWMLYRQNKGTASVAMFFYLVLYSDHFKEHPTDVFEYERCMDLVRYVPELKERFQDMAQASTIWAHFVERWNDIWILISSNERAKAQEMIEEIAYGQMPLTADSS